MRKSIINLEQHDGEMRISPRQLSEGVGVKHEASVKLIKRHKTLLESFGGYLGFQIRDKSKITR